VQNVNFNDTSIEQKIIQIGKKKKENKTDDAGNEGSQRKKRRMWEQRKLNGFWKQFSPMQNRLLIFSITF
jgi:hypothetical protein